MNKDFLAKSFQRLEKQLKKRKWRDADHETDIILLSVASREKLSPESDKTKLALPLEPVTLMDELWCKYSGGRFGFSVQKKIWLDCNGTPGMYDKLVLKKFGDAVGWRKDDYWLDLDHLKYKDNSPHGHLPTAIEHKEYCETILALLP